jgi:hypothetical protein
LSNDSWMHYFWTYYFQVGTWINSQSIIVVPPYCAYPKIFSFWIKVETPMMDLIIPCGGKMQYSHYDTNPYYIW